MGSRRWGVPLTLASAAFIDFPQKKGKIFLKDILDQPCGAQLMTFNPFTYGNPISDPTRFFGRQQEVEQVFIRLRNAETESSSIVGERRIGKTSLLHYLKHPEVRRRFGVESERYIFIYSDLQMVDQKTTSTRLYQRWMRQLAMACPDPQVKTLANEIRDSAVIDNFALADLFDTIDYKNFHVVFLLDEFEKVTSNQNFKPDFFYGLRSLAIQHNLTLITSSRSELIELTHSKEIKSSPFFNIFANINVRLLNLDEAQQLINTSLLESGIEFTEEDMKLVLRLSGNHPFFLQASCHFLFDGYQKKLEHPERLKYLLKEFREESDPHLSDYWHHSPENEKIVLTALALLDRQGHAEQHTFSLERLQDLYTRSDQTLDRLEKRGLLVERDTGYVLFSPIFSDWILAEITDTMSDSISYQDWLKSNQGVMERLGREARHQFGDILPRVAANYRDLVVDWASDPRNWVSVATLLKGVLS
jgi:hypothetical protein